MKTWAICCFFNYGDFSKKLYNYKLFRRISKLQGLNLITVEMCYDERYYLTKDDTDILVQIPTGDAIWQKERLLNLGIQHLPDDCEYVVFPDVDIMFMDKHWITDLETKLETYKVVQPFSMVNYVMISKEPEVDLLSIGLETFRQYYEIYRQACSFSRAHPSFGVVCKKVVHNENDGQSGYIWAFRREVLNEFQWYENTIIGSGDRVMANALLRLDDSHIFRNYAPALLEDISNFKSLVAETVNITDIGYLENTRILNVRHGIYANREYKNRHLLLKDNDFDPNVHLIKNVNSGLILADSYPLAGKEAIKKYFINRKEDDE